MILTFSSVCVSTVCSDYHYESRCSCRILAGVDDLLSRHIAHLFIRDPLVVFSETIDQDDQNSNDHFEVRGLTTERSSGY